VTCDEDGEALKDEKGAALIQKLVREPGNDHE
jgi:hypothetical protein